MIQPTGPEYDVVVVGAGNAALTAAISAHEHGARVLVLEKATKELRGGNSRFTGAIWRFVFDGIEDIKELVPLSEAEIETLDVQKYSYDDFYGDLMRVTQGMADPELTELLVGQSQDTVRWMKEQGMEWEITELGVHWVEGKRRFTRGGVVRAKGRGLGLMDNLFRMVEERDIEILYEARAQKLLVNPSGQVCGVTVWDRNGLRDIYARAVILACGGFQASPEMRVAYLGPEWNFVKVRGTMYDTGDFHRSVLELGAQPVGHWSGCHATPIDGNAPPVGDLALTDETNRLSYTYGITVNIHGRRFFDEGEDLHSFTYAKTGRAILAQPRALSFQIFDQKVLHLLEERYSTGTPVEADTIEELADRLEIEREALVTTVREFNDAVQEGEFHPVIRDGKCTRGIEPPKSNWALKMDNPPYVAYPATCGITFTFGGLKINKRAQVLDTGDNPIPGLYATGEITGAFFYHNYIAGAGLGRGAVFGRLAGANALADML